MHNTPENAASQEPAPQSTEAAETQRQWPPLLWDFTAFAMLAAGGAMIAMAAAFFTPGSVEPEDDRVAAAFDASVIETANISNGDAHAWSYHGEGGPDHWASLSEANAACAGGQQSPIDLADGVKAETHGFSLDWGVKGHSVVNNGHTLQVNLPEGGAMTIDGKAYRLKQLHFHTPSEHAIEGERRAMEAHFVHVADDGALAVLGVMMIEGEGHGAAAEAFHEIMTHATDHEGEAALKHGVSPRAFLPADRTHLRYQGSLTTPPCSETVLWTVLTEPVVVGGAAIHRFAGIFNDNARPLQAMNRRFLLVGQ